MQADRHNFFISSTFCQSWQALTIEDIVLYLEDSKRPLKEGMNLYMCQHVVKAGVTVERKSFTEYFGLVLQTTSPRSAPHQINLKICEDPIQWYAKCSCKAGLGHKCKHIVAVMLYLHL